MADIVRVCSVSKLQPGNKTAIQAKGESILDGNVNGSIYAASNIRILLSNDSVTLVGAALFAFTIFIIVLHAFEWVNIGTIPRTRIENTQSAKVVPKLLVLRGGLGIELVYYFLLFIAFAVYFPRDLVFLTLIAAMGLTHLVAFWAMMGQTASAGLQGPSTRSVSTVLVFDIVELVILVFLALQLYPFFLSLI
jgi:hypothetical protein